MAKVYTVKKARKDQGPCGKCGIQIKAGEGYLYWAFMIGGRGGPLHKRCLQPQCSPLPSDLTQSDFWGTVYELQARTWDDSDLDSLESDKDSVRDDLQSLLDDTSGKLDNMPEGLQQGDVGQLLQERIDALESTINDLDSIDIYWEEPGQDKDETKEDFEERKNQELQDRINEIAEAL